MKMQKEYKIVLYYTSAVTHFIKANNENEAYETALNMPLDKAQILDSLNSWTDLDEVEEII